MKFILTMLLPCIIVTAIAQQKISDSSKHHIANLVTVKANTNGYIKEISASISRLNIKNIENPQSIQVIDAGLLRDKQIQSVGEAIKLMAGVNAFSSSQYSDYTMRGFRSAPGNFAYNGSRGDFYQFDQATLTYNIESIEAIKGPASVLFSAGNPGGVINHITKKPLLHNRYEIEYTVGSFDQHRIVADATGSLTKNKKLKYRMVLGYANENQLDKNQSIENVFIAPQLQYDFSDKTSIRYEANLANDKRTMGYQRGVPAALNEEGNWQLDKYNPRTTSLIDPNGLSTKHLQLHQLTLHHKFNKYKTLTTLVSLTKATTKQFDIMPSFTDNPINDSISLINNFWNERPTNMQVSSFLTLHSNSTSYIKHNVVVGIDVNAFKRNAKYAQFSEKQVSVINPEFGWGVYNDNNITNDLVNANSQSGWNEKTILLATYIQNQINVGSKFSVLLGGRLESHKYNYDAFDLITNKLDDASIDKLTATQFIPRVGFVYLPKQSTSVYYSYAKGFIPQYGSLPNSGGPFAPEKSRQHELGIKKEWVKGKLLSTIALYHIKKMDVLALDPNDALGMRNIPIDDVTSKGVELSLQGNIAHNIDVIANYAFNETYTIETTGYDSYPEGPFPQAPKHNANIWTKYNVSKGLLKHLGLGLGYNYLSERTTFVKNFNIPAFYTIDAAINYKYHNISIGLNLYNLTNTIYWTGAYGPGNLFPANPRTFRLTVGYVF